MSFLHPLLYCILIYNLTEGRIVRGIIGRNVSFSFILSNVGKDAVSVLHDKELFFRVWPANNFVYLHEQSERVRVAVDNTAQQTVTVTVTYLNITENDGGNYSVIREWNLEEFNDSIILETIDERLIPMIATVKHDILDSTLVLECRTCNLSNGTFFWTLNGTLIENRGRYYPNKTFLFIRNLTANDQYSLYRCMELESGFESQSYNIKMWTSHYTETTNTWIDYTEGIIHQMSTAMNLKEDTEDFPSKRHLMYLVLGMGAIVTVAFLVCLIHRIENCIRVETVSNSTTITDSCIGDGDESLQEEHPRYWTIVSNAQGEMNTAIETDFDMHIGLPIIGQYIVPIENGSQHSMRSDAVIINEELDEYLNPIHSDPSDLGEYIHPVHSVPTNAGVLSKRDSSGF